MFGIFFSPIIIKPINFKTCAKMHVRCPLLLSDLKKKLECVASPNITRKIKSKGDQMGRTYSTNEVEEKCIQDISGKARRKETTRKTKT
jgi:hypothetical protein